LNWPLQQHPRLGCRFLRSSSGLATIRVLLLPETCMRRLSFMSQAHTLCPRAPLLISFFDAGSYPASSSACLEVTHDAAHVDVGTHCRALMTTTIRILSPQARPSTRNYNNTGAARLSAALETLNEEEGCGIGKGRRDAHAPLVRNNLPPSLHSTSLIHLTSYWQASWLYAHGSGTRRGSTGLVVCVPSTRMRPDPGPHWTSWMPHCHPSCQRSQ
jgi:hypothetical protein